MTGRARLRWFAATVVVSCAVACIWHACALTGCTAGTEDGAEVDFYRGFGGGACDEPPVVIVVQVPEAAAEAESPTDWGSSGGNEQTACAQGCPQLAPKHAVLKP